MTRQVDALGFRASARLLLTALGLLAISAAISCGADSSSPRDASADRAHDGGTGGAGVDGGNHEVAGESQPNGMGGSNDAGVPDAADDVAADGGEVIVDSGVDATPETCGPGAQGCARLSVPLTDPQTGTFFAVSISPTDLSGVSATFRFCQVSWAVQGNGWVQPYAQEGVAPYAGQYNTVPFASIPACPSFLDYTFNFPDAPDPNSDAGSPWFTRVQNIGLKIQSLDGATGSWANPTVIYVDSIMLDRRPPNGGTPDDGGDAVNDGGAPDDGGAVNDGGAPDQRDALDDVGASQEGDGGATQDGGLAEDGGAAPDTGTSDDGGAPAPLPGPFTFDTSSFPFGISSYMEVPGSALDWVP